MSIQAKGVGSCWMALLLSVASLAAASDDLRLLKAVKERDKAAVRSLLQEKVDVNTSQADGATALSWAAHWDDLETAELLIQAGANVNAAGDYGRTPLSLAAANRYAAMVEKLLKAGANPNARLVRELHLSLIGRLGGSRFSLITIGQGSGAYKDGSPAWLGATPLWLAAQIGNVKVMRILLDYGADPMIPTEEGTTPLLAAAGVGRLISWMDVNRESAQREGRSNLEAVKLLLELGSDVNAVGQNGWTALHGAAYTAENEIVKSLVEKGAKVDTMSKFGETPLSTALYVFTEGLSSPDVHFILGLGRQIHKDTAELLLALGATPLEESGVQVPGANTPTSSSGGQMAPTSSPRSK